MIESSLFPDIVLSDTEMSIVAAALSQPAVKKYFHSLAHSDGRDIVFSDPANGESAESYLRRKASVRGRLEVLNTLLSIEALSQ